MSGVQRAGPTLHLLCAGAAKGLVLALQPAFEAATGAVLNARFGAVGAMKEALQAGAACDLFIVTDAMVASLAEAGRLCADSHHALGRVRTGVAVRAGDAVPDVATPDALRAALLAADAVHFPDPERATAGIHFAKVMRELGVFDVLQPRLKTYPNGATAMRALADSTGGHPIGCTQVSEILYTPGAALAGALPAQFELATLYSGAVVAQASQPALAAQLLDMLSGEASATLRAQGGFEP